MITKASTGNMMLLAVYIVLLVSSTVADQRIRCGSDNEIGTTMHQAEGDIEGRYVIEWCSHIPDEATEWTVSLEYPVNNKSRMCETNNVKLRYMMKTNIHSHLILNITDRPQYCNTTCLSTPMLDLVFSSCYKIVHRIHNRHRTFDPDTSFLRVTNKFYSIEAFSLLRSPIYTIEKDTQFLIVTFNLRYIPVTVTRYDVDRKEYKENITIKDLDNEHKWLDTNDNCTHDAFTVVCRLRYPPPQYCVALALEYDAPWRYFLRDPNVMYYCSPLAKEVELGSGMDSRVWWAIGGLAFTLTVLAACWVVHTRVLADVREKVLRKWIHRYDEYTAEHTPAPNMDPGYILLLYARDCEPAMEAVSVLKEMLEAGAPGRVFDIFSAECMALYAQAPEEWLCSLLSRPDVRVVLVQTPAAAALYEAQVNQDSLQMQQPLLGARVQYKKPHYGDVLLQFALRLIRGMAPMQQEYARYYIATVSDLDAELMPQVAAYRRYVLPPHAARLLLDLRLPVDQPQRLRRLAAAVDSLLDYVRANENYLKDELMFL